MMLRGFVLLVLSSFPGGAGSVAPNGADELPIVDGVEVQPLIAQVERLLDALDFAGASLPRSDRDALQAAFEMPDALALRRIQEILDPHCLCGVHVNPESRVKVSVGAASPSLVQDGWRSFLVKVHNEAGVKAPLRVQSPQAAEVWVRSSGHPEPEAAVTAGDVRDRWLAVDRLTRAPLRPRLSGLGLEYTVLQLYSRDAGPREARLNFDVGAGTQDLGFRAECSILFDCAPGIPVRFEILDHDGEPTTAALEIRDASDRIVPAPSKRLAPDFFFQPQIYRHHGETVSLAPGRYQLRWRRGPEYLGGSREIVVPAGVTEHHESLSLQRWIFPRSLGWYSGDHHVHGGGCSHYESPTAGVRPEHMWRQQLGEDLNVAFVLSWGPCWYYQKQFFDGEVHELSIEDYLLRYDVEVSGFPSSHCGHLCLLRLQEDDFPGTARIEDWPSWNLPVLQWCKEQGGVTGYSHSGFGLGVPSEELPNHIVPAYDGIGANEYIVDVTHGAVDFLSTVDTPYVWELNIWYHTLNCGFRTRISAETDFPCIYDDRIGKGRVYCELPEGLDFDAFADAIQAGRSYVSDGKSHLLDYEVGGVEVGVGGSELRLDAPGELTVRARVAARLDPVPEDPGLRERPYWEPPYWELERARLGESRRVPLELVVNGEVVERREIEADGSLREVEFSLPVSTSCWVALRILPSSHSNPVFVTIGDQPLRASRRSAQWCLDGVDRCWQSKQSGVRPQEREAMAAAYEHARQVYRTILEESPED